VSGNRNDLSSDPEQRVDELTLAYHIAFCQPTDLPLPDQLPCLVTVNRIQRPFRRPEPQTGHDALLNKPMVLLYDIV
jgi:hypothetical protein